MITVHETTTEYTNKTSEVVMLANGITVLAVGKAEITQVSRQISQKYPWWKDDLGSTPWSVIEYVKPGETVKHNWVAHHEWLSPEEIAENNKAFENLLGLSSLPSSES